MALELKQSLGLAQQLVMTPQLQQAIKLLQLSRLELLDTISQEMEENPVLEETVGEEIEDEPPQERAEELEPEKPELSEVRVEERAREDIDWENYISEYNTGWAEWSYEGKEATSFENFTASKTDLRAHLHWQLNMSSLDEEGREIGEYIIGNLNEDGYLDTTVEQISEATGSPLDRVIKTLRTIQNFDPVGIATSDTRECLLTQLRSHHLEGSVVEQIIDRHLNDLEEKRYDRIASSLGIPMDEILSALTVIRGLDPRPGRIYSAEETIYITPDIYVFKVGDDYEIVQNEDGLPKLRISSYYKNILDSKNTVAEQTKTYVQEKLRSAAWLIKSIHQRQRTIYRVTESIVKFQKPFLDKGIAYLRPLVLSDVAEDIQMHESTISRVTTNKYVYTPQGLYELKYFFNSSINRLDGEAVASESVKEAIRKIIQREDKASPYSDKAIHELMREQNINVARRTIAKYRELLGILPSRKRRDPFSK
ncbi:MAG: RNA polymerase factor sigma-54 [Desulfobacteraceae bacterium]